MIMTGWTCSFWTDVLGMVCYVKNKYSTAVYCFNYLPLETEMVLQIKILAEMKKSL